MVTQEKGALASLLFGTVGIELLDVKCFRGDNPNVTDADISAAMHDGIMQYRLQPSLASATAPYPGVEARSVVEIAKGLPATV